MGGDPKMCKFLTKKSHLNQRHPTGPSPKSGKIDFFWSKIDRFWVQKGIENRGGTRHPKSCLFSVFIVGCSKLIINRRFVCSTNLVRTTNDHSSELYQLNGTAASSRAGGRLKRSMILMIVDTYLCYNHLWLML